MGLCGGARRERRDRVPHSTRTLGLEVDEAPAEHVVAPLGAEIHRHRLHDLAELGRVLAPLALDLECGQDGDEGGGKRGSALQPPATAAIGGVDPDPGGGVSGLTGGSDARPRRCSGAPLFRRLHLGNEGPVIERTRNPERRRRYECDLHISNCIKKASEMHES